jgi:hypothetical protein
MSLPKYFERQKALWILSCEKAIKLTYGTSAVLTQVPARALNGVLRDTPSVKLRSRHLTLKVKTNSI